MGYREQGRWWVSPDDYAPEVTERFAFAERVEILDTTLRDGEQQAGIIFTREDKVRIARALDEAGIHRIEAGTPAASREDADAVRAIVDAGLDARIFVFARNMIKDMELARSLGVHGVVAEIIGSEHLLEFGKRWTFDQAVRACVEATTAAHELGLFVTFFPADSSRASESFLFDLVDRVAEEGHIDSLVLVDTFGCFSPEGAAHRVRKLRQRYTFPVEAHFHCDFDLGVATTFAALAAGAQVAHVTVNGIGERAGSVPLEPVALGLKALYGVDTGIRTERMKTLSDLVAELSRFPVSPIKPITGDRIFGWETGLPSSLWLNCKDTDPLIMLPYHWSQTGRSEPRIYLGKKSGKDNLNFWLRRAGIPVADSRLADLLEAVKDRSIAMKRDLTEEEFAALAAPFADAEAAEAGA